MERELNLFLLKPRTDILTKEHPRWKEFIEKLSGKDYCNFRETDNTIKWNCLGGDDKSFARKILLEMKDINIRKTFQYFEEHSGYCDCEIVINVEQGDIYDKIMKAKGVIF